MAGCLSRSTWTTAYGIRLIFGRPYNPRGRGKIEAYHKVLYRELISQKEFKSLSHFRRELWKFDGKWNNWRKQEALGWQTPASVYNDEKYFTKDRELLKKRTNVLSTKPTDVESLYTSSGVEPSSGPGNPILDIHAGKFLQ